MTKKQRVWIGVDLGVSGGIAIIGEDEKLKLCKVMPVNDVIVNKKIRQEYDIKTIIETLEVCSALYEVRAVCFERLRPMPAQASQTGFSLGYATGLFRGILVKMGLPYTECEPRKWQKMMFAGINYTSKETKVASAMVANRLFPDNTFKKTDRCSKPHDGMTDAACIAYFIKAIQP